MTSISAGFCLQSVHHFVGLQHAGSSCHLIWSKETFVIIFVIIIFTHIIFILLPQKTVSGSCCVQNM
jgi:hypothetical protein